MELFIELKGSAASGTTRIINDIKELLEKDYHVMWRRQDLEDVHTVQVLADIEKKRVMRPHALYTKKRRRIEMEIRSYEYYEIRRYAVGEGDELIKRFTKLSDAEEFWQIKLADKREYAKLYLVRVTTMRKFTPGEEEE